MYNETATVYSDLGLYGSCINEAAVLQVSNITYKRQTMENENY